MPKTKSKPGRKAVITITEESETQIDVAVRFYPDVDPQAPAPISAQIAVKVVRYISELAAGR